MAACRFFDPQDAITTSQLRKEKHRMAEDPNNSQQQQIPTATHNKTENTDATIDAKKHN